LAFPPVGAQYAFIEHTPQSYGEKPGVFGVFFVIEQVSLNSN
jgi:hypothetical protein